MENKMTITANGISLVIEDWELRVFSDELFGVAIKAFCSLAKSKSAIDELKKSQSADSNPDFQVGDLVQLKSGGPVMTVIVIDGPRMDTTWFQGDGTRLCGKFHSATLKHYQAGK
jgi:uncharacterized protein YodC (DUF2158 family)